MRFKFEPFFPPRNSEFKYLNIPAFINLANAWRHQWCHHTLLSYIPGLHQSFKKAKTFLKACTSAPSKDVNSVEDQGVYLQTFRRGSVMSPMMSPMMSPHSAWRHVITSEERLHWSWEALWCHRWCHYILHNVNNDVIALRISDFKEPFFTGDHMTLCRMWWHLQSSKIQVNTNKIEIIALFQFYL